MTQYERDFERISTVVRKEVIRFEVKWQILISHECVVPGVVVGLVLPTGIAQGDRQGCQ